MMITQFRSSASWSDTLKARKEHLAALLKIVDIKTGKTTTVQALTINLIKNEMSDVESKLKGRP
jgi:endonuclease III